MKTDQATFKRNLAEHYDSDAVDYHKRNYVDETPYSPLWFRQHYIEQMIESAGIPRGSKILDVGCGPGELVVSLLKKSYRVWGIDISPKMIDEAAELLRGNGFASFDQLSVGDIEALKFADGFFDVVIASGVIEHQKTDADALNEMNRVLAKGGHLILNVTNRYSGKHLFGRSFYQGLKRLPAVRGLLAAIKRNVLHRGELVIIPPARTHVPGRFDRALETHGFRIMRHNYFDFTPIPTPFDAAFHSLCLRIGKKMERLSTTALGRLGGGYLVMAKKVAPPSI